MRNNTKIFLHKMEKIRRKEKKLRKPKSKIQKRAKFKILMRSTPKMLHHSPKQRTSRSPKYLRKKPKFPRSNLSQIPKMAKRLQTLKTKNSHRQKSLL